MPAEARPVQTPVQTLKLQCASRTGSELTRLARRT